MISDYKGMRQLLGEEVIERFHGVKFVVFDVEDGVELGDVEDVFDLLGEIEQLEFAAGVADGGEGADQFADPGAVDVIHLGEVQDDLLLAFAEQIPDGGAEIVNLIAEDDTSAQVQDGDVRHFAGIDGERHGSAGMVVGAAGQVKFKGLPRERQGDRTTSGV